MERPVGGVNGDNGDRDNRAEATLSRTLFLVIVAIELVHTFTAILQHRVPGGHDGFQYFTLQYYFLNNAIQAHEVAQWIPFMSHGTVSTFWYGVQGSFLQNVLLYTGSLLRDVDLLSIYHVGMFADEMILLAGTWLLARRFFRTPAVFFIAVSVVGSCVWLEQPYWNFRLYYAIPLVLELGHRFLDSGRWRWFFLTVNLLALQSVGNLPYFIPVASFVVFAYFAGYAAANWPAVWTRVRSLRWRGPALLAVALGGLSLVAVYAYLTIGTGQLASYNVGRSQDGRIDAATFLTYGGVTDLHKWIELVLNLSPWLDLTLYAGVLLAPLLLCGALVTDRRRIHFVVIAVALLLFTLATPVSLALFRLWPGMKYFRHIGLVSPLVKVLFCFVAGIGFEWLFVDQGGRGDPPDQPRHLPRNVWPVRVGAIAGALLLAAGGWQALRIADSRPAIDRYLGSLTAANVDWPAHTYQPDVMAKRLRSSATVAFAGAAVLVVFPLMLASRRFKSGRRAPTAMVCAVLAFVAADVYRFKFAYLVDRSDVVRPGERFVTRASSMPYPIRRERDLQPATFNNARLAATLRFSPMLLRAFQGRSPLGAQYWTNNAFWFTDEAGSSFQVDSWLKPLDQLVRLYRGIPINESTVVPGFGYGHLDFPPDHVAAARVSGVTADKIRFFTHAYSVAAPDDLVPLMSDDWYNGDLLFVLPADAANGQAAPSPSPPSTSSESTLRVSVAAPVPWASQQPLSADDSRLMHYEVQQFDSNNLIAKVVNSGPATAWMSYADVWHPSWHATVNGRRVPVYRANMAYKAVPIDSGENVVHFTFGSRLFSVLSALFAANAAFWLCAAGWMIGAMLTNPLGDPSNTTGE